MMLMNQTILPYPMLKLQQEKQLSKMKCFAVLGIIFWAIHWLVPYLRTLKFLQVVFEIVDGTYLVKLAAFLMRWGLTGLFAWYLIQCILLYIQLYRRQHPSGVPALLDRELVDTAKERLNALHEACEGPDPFRVQALDVRVQVFTPAADLPQKDGLLRWNEDSTAEINLNSRQSIHLVEEDDRPRIIGLVDAGMSGHPNYKEVSCQLPPHTPIVICRGEGNDCRQHFAITYLYDKRDRKGGGQYD